MGNVADKTIKNRFASLGIFASLAGKIAHGPLSFDADRQVTELASPVGVVFAVVPVTNPVATAMFKILIAVKARNALILSFHHQALGVGELTVASCASARGARRASGSRSVRRRPGKATRRFMSHREVALVLATGAGRWSRPPTVPERGHWRRPGNARRGSARTPISIARPARSWRAKHSTTA
jgi:acyl-CoA reductase-like NAD-dependent aldehyde dehydrogenase